MLQCYFSTIFTCSDWQWLHSENPKIKLNNFGFVGLLCSKLMLFGIVPPEIFHLKNKIFIAKRLHAIDLWFFVFFNFHAIECIDRWTLYVHSKASMFIFSSGNIFIVMSFVLCRTKTRKDVNWLKLENKIKTKQHYESCNRFFFVLFCFERDKNAVVLCVPFPLCSFN